MFPILSYILNISCVHGGERCKNIHFYKYFTSMKTHNCQSDSWFDTKIIILFNIYYNNDCIVLYSEYYNHK